MKVKCLLAGILTAILFLTYPFSTIVTATESDLAVNPLLAELHLDTYVRANADGSLPLPEDSSLLNVCFPTNLGGQPIDTIAPGGFQGCSYFRSVFLPAQIVNIGDNAFADCTGLEYIVLMGRHNTDGMVLGDNWFGNATVVFGLIKEEAVEPTESTDATTPAESTEATEPTGEVTPTESTEATEPTGETTPTESTNTTEPTVAHESTVKGAKPAGDKKQKTVPPTKSAKPTEETTAATEPTTESVSK